MAAETIKYLGGEVELTAAFFPDAEGNERMEKLKYMDMLFKVGGNLHNIHISVKQENNVYTGVVLADPKQIEALFIMQENEQ